jgi:hypothetical protein
LGARMNRGTEIILVTGVLEAVASMQPNQATCPRWGNFWAAATGARTIWAVIMYDGKLGSHTLLDVC